MNNYELRFAETEDVRFEAGEDGVITGYPVVFDKPANIGGEFVEYIERGALDECDLRDVQFLVNHNGDGITLARSRRNNENSTMQLTVDETGLFMRTQLDIENNSEARALYSAIQRGDITGMSFCFVVGSERWEDLRGDNPIRHIDGIEYIREVSAVNWPAYPDTIIQARSADAVAAVETARAALDNADKNALDLAKAKARIKTI